MENQLLDIISNVDINSIKSIKWVICDIRKITPTYDDPLADQRRRVVFNYFSCVIYHTKRLIIAIRSDDNDGEQMAIVCNNKCIFIEIYILMCGSKVKGFYIDETIDETIKILLEQFRDIDNVYSINLATNYFREYKPKCEHEPTIDWLIAGPNSTKSARNI